MRGVTRSLHPSPDDVQTLNNRTVACRKLNKNEQAGRDFEEEALRIDQAFEQARKNLEGLPSPP